MSEQESMCLNILQILLAVSILMTAELTIYPPVANFLQYIQAKNYENWLRVDKVIAMKTACRFFGPPCTDL